MDVAKYFRKPVLIEGFYFSCELSKNFRSTRSKMCSSTQIEFVVPSISDEEHFMEAQVKNPNFLKLDDTLKSNEGKETFHDTASYSCQDDDASVKFKLGDDGVAKTPMVNRSSLSKVREPISRADHGSLRSDRVANQCVRADIDDMLVKVTTLKDPGESAAQANSCDIKTHSYRKWRTNLNSPRSHVDHVDVSTCGHRGGACTFESVSDNPLGGGHINSPACVLETSLSYPNASNTQLLPTVDITSFHSSVESVSHVSNGLPAMFPTYTMEAGGNPEGLLMTYRHPSHPPHPSHPSHPHPHPHPPHPHIPVHNLMLPMIMPQSVPGMIFHSTYPQPMVYPQQMTAHGVSAQYGNPAAFGNPASLYPVAMMPYSWTSVSGGGTSSQLMHGNITQFYGHNPTSGLAVGQAVTVDAQADARPIRYR